VKEYLVGIFCEALVEAVHTTFCIDQFRAARKERVAAGAGVDVHLLDGGVGFDLVSAGAANYLFFLLWMNICLHG